MFCSLPVAQLLGKQMSFSTPKPSHLKNLTQNTNVESSFGLHPEVRRGAEGRGARRNFFGGGKRSIHYLLDEINRYNCNQDFAKGFEPIVKMILFKKWCNLGGMLSKLMHFNCIMDGGLRAKLPVAERFSQFL